MELTFEPTAISDVILVKTDSFEDERGLLFETYNHETFGKNGIRDFFHQEKHSYSKQHVLRGLHFQNDPYGQSKLVRCNFGRIFDVAVDIRPHSPTYKKWVGVELSADNKHSLYIPKGFAHGFVVLSEEGAGFQYMIGGAPYNKVYDSGIHFNDPDIGIVWPVDTSAVILSDKDTNMQSMAEYGRMREWHTAT